MHHCGGGEGDRFVGVGGVDGDVERLVGDLPAQGSGGAETGREHAGCYDKVGEDVGGHAEGEEDLLASVLMP